MFLSDFNTHPPLSGLPLGFVLLLVLVELLPARLAVRRARFTLVVVLLFSVLAAFVSGYHGSEFADASFKISDQDISYHHSFGRLALILAFVLLVFARLADTAKYSRLAFLIIYRLILIATLLVISYTGFLGGELVFSHGAGVKATIVEK